MKTKIKFKQTEIGEIPEDWEEKPLSSLVTFQRGHDLPIDKMKPGKYPVIGSNGIIGYHDEFKVRGPGVTIGRSGNLGSPFFVKDDYWPHNTTLYIKEFHNSDPRFIYYFLKRLRLGRFNVGSAVPTLNRNHIHTLPVVAPRNLMEQRAVASILSSLDSKIEINQQMNKTLEAIGQAIFKHWFIDFEFPNEKGKPYKSSGGEMVDSEMGKIPKGWNVKQVLDCGAVVCGKTPLTAEKDNYGEDLPFITIPDMHNQLFIVKTERKLSFKGASTQRKKELPPLSICVSCIATPGLVSLTTEQSHTNQQINSIICNANISPYFMFYSMKHKSEEIKLKGLGGTTTLNLNTGDFGKIKLIIPPDRVIREFHNLILSISNKILINYKQTEALCEIRDSLMPKLMSGKIRVPVEVS